MYILGLKQYELNYSHFGLSARVYFFGSTEKVSSIAIRKVTFILFFL